MQRYSRIAEICRIAFHVGGKLLEFQNNEVRQVTQQTAMCATDYPNGTIR